MGRALQRILRIRHLAEEQARLEVERAAQRARQTSAACARQATLEHEQRTALAASWVHRLEELEKKALSVSPLEQLSEATEENGWLMEEAMLEFFGWRRMRLEQLRQAELQRMAPLVEEYTERRRELRQTERLIDQRASIEAMEKNRRAQAETDEWFSQRTLMQQRRELRRTGVGCSQTSSDEARLPSREGVLRQF